MFGDDRGEAVSPVLHYMAEKFCGTYMLDQIMEGQIQDIIQALQTEENASKLAEQVNG